VHDGEALGYGDGDGRCSHGFFRRLVSGLGLVLGFSQLCVCVCVSLSLSLSLSFAGMEISTSTTTKCRLNRSIQSSFGVPDDPDYVFGIAPKYVCRLSLHFPITQFIFSELSGVLDFYTEHASHHHHGSKVFLLAEFGPGIRSFWVLRYRVHGVHGS
jgi:hypothetical protein